MIREHVELRRPEFTVVLDAAADVADADDFEEMVDIVALDRGARAAQRRRRAGAHDGARVPRCRPPARSATRRCSTCSRRCTRRRATRSMSLAEIFRSGLDHTAIMLVTGPKRPVEHVRPHRPAVGRPRRQGARARRPASASPSRRRRVRACGGGRGATDARSRRRVTRRQSVAHRDPGRPSLRDRARRRRCATVLAIVAGRAFDDLVWPLLAVPPIVTERRCAVLPAQGRSSAPACSVAGVVVATVRRGPAHRRRRRRSRRRSVHRRQAPAQHRVAEPARPADRRRRRLLLGRACTASRSSSPDVRSCTCAAAGGDRRVHRRDGDLGTGPSDAGRPRRRSASVTLVLMMLRPGDDARARARTLGADRPFAARGRRRSPSPATWSRAPSHGPTAPTRGRPSAAESPRRCSTRSRRPSRCATPTRRSTCSAITDRSTLIGPSLPARWRLQALDVYDGQRWTPAITVRPIGTHARA